MHSTKTADQCRRLASLEKELKEIKQRLKFTSETNNLQPVDVSRSETPSPVEGSEPPQLAQAVTESSSHTFPKALGGVELDSSTVSDLLKEQVPLSHSSKIPSLTFSKVLSALS